MTRNSFIWKDGSPPSFLMPWNKETPVEPESLEEVRQQIDRIDREMVRLVAERDSYVKQVVQFKTTTADVEAPQRVEAVIDKVRALASENGTDPDIVEQIYRAMIGCFIRAGEEGARAVVGILVSRTGTIVFRYPHPSGYPRIYSL